MTIKRIYWNVVAAALLATAAHAQDIATNRLTVSARLGFNISARFKGSTSAFPTPVNPRTTPQGDHYNYDDGYVLTDSSGNYGSQTWYWGYDNSATFPSGQISDGVTFPENTILLSRSTANGNFSSPSMDDDISPGVELAYTRLLGQWKGANIGVEFAANWQSLSMGNSGSFRNSATRVTDAYPFTPGTTPPSATTQNPYQGAYGDEGFLIGDTPVNSSSSTVRQAVEISGRQDFEANLYGFRLGPYVSFPIADRLNVMVSGGLAMGLLDSTASWADTITFNGASVSSTGHGSDFGTLWGGFVGANLIWDLNDRLSATLGAQYQNLGTYDAGFGERHVEVDMSGSFFVLLGVSYRF